MNKIAVCTNSSINYYPFGKTLLQSVAALHPECDLFYILADDHTENIPIEAEFSIIPVKEVNIPNLQQMAFVYEITEFNTAIKPFFFEYLFKKGYEKIIFLDPDIFVYSRLDEVIKALDNYSIVLTPHSIHPAPPPTSFLDKVQWEQNMTYTGIFNLGFIAISQTPETLEFLAWWKERCRYLCFIEPNLGIFVDQKWAELTIAFWDPVFILRHDGYNVSLWNLHERSIQDHIVNKHFPLVFYHFSAIDINDDSFLSKHVKSIGFFEHPELQKLYTDYRELIHKNGYLDYRPFPYAYNYFADGTTIDLLERRLYAMVADYYTDPFLSTKKEFYKKIKYYGRDISSLSKQNVLTSKAAFWFVRIFGPKLYRHIISYLSKSQHLRSHTFLLK